ncbi:MAG: energy-coupling factor ABC transporter ATP-binding protein [Coriobacteriales bacterium]|jgi:energy-coupling factor transport system ATP-binding protein|nr:energy-coupling factor ABC transporter ATP-binding protein [Coriobacteriales bacterium]
MVSLAEVSFAYQSTEEQPVPRADAGSLHEVSIEVRKGECLLLVGESGSGKTTLLRLMNGLIPHYYEGRLSGEVRVDGRDVGAEPLYASAGRIGTVFQNPRSQFFNVDVSSEIAFGMENLGLPAPEIRERSARAAHELRISHLAGRSLFKLSGGEKQRVACASVAALQPEVLVLDEPSSNLDMRSIAALRQQVGLWRSQGKTIIIAEHRLHYLVGLADRVLYLHEGRVVSQHSMEELRALGKARLREMGLRTLDLGSLLDDEGDDEGRSTEIYGVATCAADAEAATTPSPAGAGAATPSPTSANANVAAPAPTRDSADAGHLRLEGFSFSYRSGVSALDIPSLALPEAGVIAIVGANGAGKTTLARCLCGLEQGCKGEVIIGGRRLDARARRKACFMVMQEVGHQLFTESVTDELLLGMDSPDDDRALAILRELGLGEMGERHPVSLSGGQQQRVAVASAIASEREIIVFDEPTSGLDMRHMRQVASCIDHLRQRGCTLLVITHDPELICACCTHVLRLEQGAVAGFYALDRYGKRRLLRFFTDELSAAPTAAPATQDVAPAPTTPTPATPTAPTAAPATQDVATPAPTPPPPPPVGRASAERTPTLSSPDPLKLECEGAR